MRKLINLWLLSFCALCANPMLSMATECGAASPRLQALGEHYYDLELVNYYVDNLEKLTDRDSDAIKAPIASTPKLSRVIANRNNPGYLEAVGLQKLLNRLLDDEFMQGHGPRVVCARRDGQDVAIEQVFELKNIKRTINGTGDNWLEALEHREKARHIHTHRSDHDSRNSYASRNSPLAPSTLDLPNAGLWRTAATPNTLSANQRVRRSAPGSVSYLVEISTEAQAIGEDIEIRQRFFVNGYYTELLVWRLSS